MRVAGEIDFAGRSRRFCSLYCLVVYWHSTIRLCSNTLILRLGSISTGPNFNRTFTAVAIMSFFPFDAWDHRRQFETSNDYVHLFGDPCVTFDTGRGFDRFILANPLYRQRLFELFNTTSRFQIVARSTRYLLSVPKVRYRDRIDEAITKMGIRHFAKFIVVQLRTFFDAPTGRELVLGRQNDIWACFVRCVKQETQDYKKEDVGLMFTTDDRTFEQTAKDHFAPMATVLINDMPFEHTGYSTGDHVSGAMVDFWLIGEANVSMGTGTTFSQFATARAGGKQKHFVFDLDPKNCELMPQNASTTTCGWDICY